MLNRDGFLAICEPGMKDLYWWLTKEMKSYYGEENVVSKEGFLFAIGDTPMCFCAHLDTVHKDSPIKFHSEGEKLSSPQGIGGDDRCGIFGILCILRSLEKENMKPYLFFSTDEETGMKTTTCGANSCKDLVKPIKFLVELDRANSKDSVYYQCGNKEFKKFIDEFGFKEADGSGSDIKILCKEWDVAGVNLSCGYYLPHTTREYVILSELEQTVKKCVKIAKASHGCKKFQFLEEKYGYGNNGYEMKNRQLFFAGDRVFVKRGGAIGKITTSVTEKQSVDIPEFTSLIVLGACGQYISVFYNDKHLWVHQSNVVLDVR